MKGLKDARAVARLVAAPDAPVAWVVDAVRAADWPHIRRRAKSL